MWAFNYNNPEAVKILLKLGANVNAKDNNGRTVLCWSLSDSDNGNLIASMKLLLEAGADTNIKDNNGHTAIDITRESENEEVLEASARKNRKR